MAERKIFALKLNEEEKAMLSTQAKAQSMDRSVYLRWLLRQVDRGRLTSKMVRGPGRPAFKKGVKK
jgi:hypothetical protein